MPRLARFVSVVASLERHEAAWQAEGAALRPKQGQKTRFGIWILRVAISIDAADVHFEALFDGKVRE
jgi:hypothetical protein